MSMNQIEGNLYLGSWKDAHQMKGVSNWKVITVAVDSPEIGDHFFPMSDPGTAPTDLENFKLAVEKTIELLDNGHNVLVHCVAGVNRSPSVVMAVLMTVYNLSLKETFLTVQTCRPHIDPCEGQQKLACLITQRDWEAEKFQPPVVVLNEHELAVNSLYRIHLKRSADSRWSSILLSPISFRSYEYSKNRTLSSNQ